MSGPAAGPVRLVVPGPIGTATGGFVYDRRIADGLRRLGRLGEAVELSGAWPRPGPGEAEAALARLAASDPGSGTTVVDGLAFAALSEAARRTGARPWRAPPLALVHHPLCDETGLAADEAAALFRAERRALGEAAGCVVTSPATARRLAGFGVPAGRVRVVLPGLDRPEGGVPDRAGRSGPVRLLCVATLVPRKGQDVLLDALSRLGDLDWRLDLVGGARDPRFAEEVRRRAAAPGFAGRVRLSGEATGGALAARYRAADIFVLASWHEGFGMALAEAMAHGLPVVSTRAGAIPETVGEGAGPLVPPGDPAALAAALRRMLADRGARLRLGAAARASAARRFPGWDEAAARFAAAADDLARAARGAAAA